MGNHLEVPGAGVGARRTLLAAPRAPLLDRRGVWEAPPSQLSHLPSHHANPPPCTSPRTDSTAHSAAPVTVWRCVCAWLARVLWCWTVQPAPAVHWRRAQARKIGGACELTDTAPAGLTSGSGASNGTRTVEHQAVAVCPQHRQRVISTFLVRLRRRSPACALALTAPDGVGSANLPTERWGERHARGRRFRARRQAAGGAHEVLACGW